jgi:hypothetical protein
MSNLFYLLHFLVLLIVVSKPSSRICKIPQNITKNSPVCRKKNWDNSMHDLLFEASLEIVASFKIDTYFDKKRETVMLDYFEKKLSLEAASRKLDSLIELRKKNLGNFNTQDVYYLAYFYSRQGTIKASYRAMLLMEQFVFSVPHPKHFGELGSIYELNGLYVQSVENFRKELIERLSHLIEFDASLSNGRNSNSVQINKNKVHSCIRRNAWRVQDDFLAEANWIKKITRFPDDKAMKYSSSLYLRNWSTSENDDLLLEHIVGNQAIKTGIEGNVFVKVQWHWNQKEVIIVEMKQEMTLLDAGSATFGFLGSHKGVKPGNGYGRENSSSSCVAFSRSVEHMEGWRKLSRIQSKDEIRSTASWSSFSTPNNNSNLQQILLHNNNSLVVPVLGAFSFNNHFHWIVDVMARAVVFKRNFLQRSNAVALFPEWVLKNKDGVNTGKRRILETVALLGIPADRVIMLSPKESMINIKNVAFIEWRRIGSVDCPSYLQLNQQNIPPQCWRKWNKSISPNNLFTPPSVVLRDIRDTVWHYSESISKSITYQLPERPYIVFAHRGYSSSKIRSFIGGQKTINTLTTLLQKELESTHDVLAVETGDLSLLEQVQLFRYSDGVVGPHGAALSNIVFCRPGSIVVELPTTEHSSMSFFQDISASLGLLHTIVPSAACDKEERYNMTDSKMHQVVKTALEALNLKFESRRV